MAPYDSSQDVLQTTLRIEVQLEKKGIVTWAHDGKVFAGKVLEPSALFDTKEGVRLWLAAQGWPGTLELRDVRGTLLTDAEGKVVLAVPGPTWEPLLVSPDGTGWIEFEIRVNWEGQGSSALEVKLHAPGGVIALKPPVLKDRGTGP